MKWGERLLSDASTPTNPPLSDRKSMSNVPAVLFAISAGLFVISLIVRVLA